MKKVLLTMVAGLGLFLVSCASNEQKAIDIIKDATEQIKNADSEEAIKQISEEMEKKGEALNLTAEEEEALQENPEFKEALSEMMQVSITKAFELAGK